MRLERGETIGGSASCRAGGGFATSSSYVRMDEDEEMKEMKDYLEDEMCERLAQ